MGDSGGELMLMLMLMFVIVIESEIRGQNRGESATQGFWLLTSLAVAVCVLVGVPPIPVTVKV